MAIVLVLSACSVGIGSILAWCHCLYEKDKREGTMKYTQSESEYTKQKETPFI